MARRERSLFIDDVAQVLGVSRRTVYYRIREGRLRTIRTIGGSRRVLVSSVEELLREARGLPAEAKAGDGDECGELDAESLSFQV